MSSGNSDIMKGALFTYHHISIFLFTHRQIRRRVGEVIILYVPFQVFDSIVVSNKHFHINIHLICDSLDIYLKLFDNLVL